MMGVDSLPAAPAASAFKFTILIADDDDIGRKGVLRLLSREGFQCLEAKTGSEAQEILHAGNVDLMLADIKMQGNTELELLKYLQEIKPRVPVILMTGYPTVETAVAATSFSAAAYLLKPLDPEKLIETVRKELEFRMVLIGLHQSLLRQESMMEGMRKLEAALGLSSHKAENELVASYANLAFENAINTLIELKEMMKPVLARNRVELNECFNRSRPAALISALHEAIQVIDRTKSSFKSKELAALRQKLEGVLREN